MKAAVLLHPLSEISVLRSKREEHCSKVSAASTAHMMELGPCRWQLQLQLALPKQGVTCQSTFTPMDLIPCGTEEGDSLN